MVARGFHHLAVQVRDLARVERFYCDVLGLKVLRHWPATSGVGQRSVWLDVGDGAFLALEVVASGTTAAKDPARRDRPGLHLVALRIAAGERARWEERLARAGVEVYHRTSFTIYLRDPEGNGVGLSHHPEAALDSDSDGLAAGPAGQPGRR
jgi:glyoxylase I family protein